MVTNSTDPRTIGYATGLVASRYPEEVRTKFRENLASGQRMGQAFMNAIPIFHYKLLTGTEYDPFNADDPAAISQALDIILVAEHI